MVGNDTEKISKLGHDDAKGLKFLARNETVVQYEQGQIELMSSLHEAQVDCIVESCLKQKEGYG